MPLCEEPAYKTGITLYSTGQEAGVVVTAATAKRALENLFMQDELVAPYRAAA